MTVIIATPHGGNMDKERYRMLLSGFLDGFAAPANLFGNRAIQRPAFCNASPAKAWRDVGTLLNSAGEGQGVAGGEVRRVKKQRRPVPVRDWA